MEPIPGNEMRPADDSLDILTPDPNSGKLVRWVRVSASDGAVLFRKVEDAPFSRDRRASLQSTGWIELELEGRKVIIFTSARPTDSITLTRTATGKEGELAYAGSLAVDPVLNDKAITTVWNPGRDKPGTHWRAQITKSGQLTFSLSFKKEGTDTITMMDAALAQPLRLLCDEQVIASFRLVRND